MTLQFTNQRKETTPYFRLIHEESVCDETGNWRRKKKKISHCKTTNLMVPNQNQNTVFSTLCIMIEQPEERFFLIQSKFNRENGEKIKGLQCPHLFNLQMTD